MSTATANAKLTHTSHTKDQPRQAQAHMQASTSKPQKNPKRKPQASAEGRAAPAQQEEPAARVRAEREARARRPLPRQSATESSGSAPVTKDSLETLAAPAAQAPKVESNVRAGWPRRPKDSWEAREKEEPAQRAPAYAARLRSSRIQAPTPSPREQRWA